MEYAPKPKVKSTSLTSLTYDYLLSTGSTGATNNDILKHLPAGSNAFVVSKLLDNGCYRGFFEIWKVSHTSSGKVSLYRVAPIETFKARHAYVSEQYKRSRAKKKLAARAAAPPQQRVVESPPVAMAPRPHKPNSFTGHLYSILEALNATPGNPVSEQAVVRYWPAENMKPQRITVKRTHKLLLDGYHLGYFERSGDKYSYWTIASKDHWDAMKQKRDNYAATRRMGPAHATTNPLLPVAEPVINAGLVGNFVPRQHVLFATGVGVILGVALSYALWLLE